MRGRLDVILSIFPILPYDAIVMWCREVLVMCGVQGVGVGEFMRVVGRLSRRMGELDGACLGVEMLGFVVAEG